MIDFETSLDKYAELIVKVGINLQEGQSLVMNGSSHTRGMPIEGAPLVRKIVEHAYKAGAPLVDVLWDDPEVAKIRLRHSSNEALANYYPEWRTKGIHQSLANGAALFTLYATDPDVFKGIDSEKIGAEQQAASIHFAPALDIIIRNQTNWSLASVPVAGWAAKVFPDLETPDAISRLWEMIFTLCRLDRPDPVAAWKEHIADLQTSAHYLNERQFDALHYTGPGTDLTIGMPANHIWESASKASTAGITYVGNLPTEEIFSTPHKDRTQGTVRAALPLSYSGTLIEDFSVSFEAGRAVKVAAKKGVEALEQLIKADEGAAFLGEVALVPQSSPIAQTGILFYNTLFDENASSHIALGSAPRETISGGENMSDEEFAAAGGNHSIVHVDFMIGSSQIDIDGQDAKGNAIPVMRQGEWAFDA